MFTNPGRTVLVQPSVFSVCAGCSTPLVAGAATTVADHQAQSTYLVAVQCALYELADLLKHCRLVCGGAKDLVKGEGVLLWRLAGQAAGHCDVNGTALLLACANNAVGSLGRSEPRAL